MTMGFRAFDQPRRSPDYGRVVGQANRDIAEAGRRLVHGLNPIELRAQKNHLVVELQRAIKLVPAEMISVRAYLATLLDRVNLAKNPKQLRELAVDASRVSDIQESLRSLSLSFADERRANRLALATALVTVVILLSACDGAQPAEPPAVTVEVDPTATPEPATATPEPKPTATVTPAATDQEGGPVTPEIQDIVNSVRGQLAKLGIIAPAPPKDDPSTEFKPDTVSARVIEDKSSGTIAITFTVTEAGLVQDNPNALQPGDQLKLELATELSPEAMEKNINELTAENILTLSARGSWNTVTAGLPEEVRLTIESRLEEMRVEEDTQGRAQLLGIDGDSQETYVLATVGGENNTEWELGEDLLKLVDELGGDNLEFNPTTGQWEEPTPPSVTPEQATATTAPATEVSPPQPTATPVPPETATPIPAPTEGLTTAPTAEPTAEEVNSPEHVQAMENIRKWRSGEMQVPDEWRFRRLNGDLQSYGRVDEEVQDDRTMNPTESYSGVVLGWAKLPNGDVITYLGFEDNGGTRFVAPFRIGNNATTFGNIALVDSLENSTAGNNSDTVVFLKPESFGEKFEESIGRQVVISILFSFSQYSSDQLEQVPEFSLREFSDQFDLAKIFDSAMIKIMRGAEFEELSLQEKSIFIQYTNSGNGLLRITQAVI